MTIYNARPAWLLLEDGALFEGKSFGAAGRAIGEVVFTTGMTGCQETLTDPSYFGQIALQTFPLIGNYGANDDDRESDRIYMNGYIVREWCDAPSNFRASESIDAFLKRHHTVGLFDIDTRALTRRLRERGVQNGLITTEPVGENREALRAELAAYRVTGAVEGVTIKKPVFYPAHGAQRYHIALLDFGYKRNLRESLRARGCGVTVLPAHTPAEEILALCPDGILLSNGPGDPAENVAVIQTLRQLAAANIPLMGVCLGHQLLALAMGAKTVKMPYGHRGGNQPVRDLQTGQTYVTTQNHGYAVLADSIDPAVGTISHQNANDQSCEGIAYHTAPAFTVQFHPEACAGPADTSFLFDRFLSMIDRKREGDAACR